MKLNKQILTKLVKEEKAKLLQGTHTYGTGDIVKDINPDCPHHGAEGKVTKVGKGTITFIVTNNGKNYKEGDELEKTEDQMVKLTTEGKLSEGYDVIGYSKRLEKIYDEYGMVVGNLKTDLKNNGYKKESIELERAFGKFVYKFYMQTRNILRRTNEVKEGKLTEAKETPQVGDEVILVASSYYSHEIIQISGSDVIVDNKKGRKAPAVILGKKNDKMGFYKPKFKIKINNLKKSGASWVLKSGNRAIDGKDLEFEMMGRGKVFGYVNEAKLTEGNPYGLTYKKGKTVKVKHKTSGKELIIIDKPNVRKEYEKIGYVAEGKLTEAEKVMYVVGLENGEVMSGDKAVSEKKALQIMSRIARQSDGWVNPFMIGVKYWNGTHPKRKGKPHKANKKKIMVKEGKLTEGIKRWKIYVKGQSKPFVVGADSSSKAKQLAHMMIKNSSIKIDKIVQEIVNEKHTVWRKTPHTGKIKKGMYVWFVDNRGTQRIKVKHIMKAKDGKDLYITNKGTFEEKDVAGY